MSDQDDLDRPITLTLGREQLVVRRRYEVLSILNDFFIAIWFLVRPALRLAARIHLNPLPESSWER